MQHTCDMTTAWTSEFLTDEQRRALVGELWPIASHATGSQVVEFVNRIDEALAAHMAVGQPVEGQIHSEADRFAELAKAGAALRKRLRALPEHSRDLLEQGLWSVTGKPADGPDTNAVAHLESLVHGASKASEALHARAAGRRKKAVANPVLLTDIGLAYCECFGELPSAQYNGLFRRILAATTDITGVKIPSNRRALGDMLSKIAAVAPSPKHGRKAAR